MSFGHGTQLVLLTIERNWVATHNVNPPCKISALDMADSTVERDDARRARF